jgi:CDP-diacylglycerol--glycerol-3-phosphate 3-phosphatidyltransferase
MERSEIIKQLPNWLTYLRLLLVPFFVALLVDPTEGMIHVAAVVFLIAAFTDYFDGWLARRIGVVSDLGKLLDPLADKILVMAALVMLVSQRSDIDGEPWVPAWLVVLILAREIWVTGLRAIAAKKGEIVAAQQSAKYKSALQMVAIFFLLMHRPGDLLGFQIHYGFVGLMLLVLSVAFSLWSAIDYTTAILGQKKP